jgi:acid stress-induced BolA-like protein IbaG/YrbA
VLPVVAHSPLAGHILTVTRDGSHVSINGILKALVTAGHGARRQDVYAEIGAMLADGRLVKVHDVIKPARDR